MEWKIKTSRGPVRFHSVGEPVVGIPANPGTRWTEPGQGATVTQLWKAAWRIAPRADDLWKQLRALASDIKRYRTNLALTGQPLTAEDVQNIARAK